MKVEIYLGVLIGNGMLCDRLWRMHMLTGSHVLAISDFCCNSGLTNRWKWAEGLLVRWKTEEKA